MSPPFSESFALDLPKSIDLLLDIASFVNKKYAATTNIKIGTTLTITYNIVDDPGSFFVSYKFNECLLAYSIIVFKSPLNTLDVNFSLVL